MRLRAPWATDKVLEEVLAHPRKWKSERLGRLVNLTGEEWRKLRIRIAPVDMSKEERRDYSRILSNGKRLKKRRTKGMKSRAEYLEANSLSRDEPWKAEGVSRTTWCDREKGRTGLAAIHKTMHTTDLSRSGHAALSKNAKVNLAAFLSTEARPPNCLLHQTH